MNQQEAEMDAAVGDASGIDAALKAFWERARAAADLITQLRAQERSLNERLSGLEREVASLRSESAAKEQELKRHRLEHAQLINSNGQSFLSDEEKETLKNRIRELIAKINSHL